MALTLRRFVQISDAVPVPISSEEPLSHFSFRSVLQPLSDSDETL